MTGGKFFVNTVE